MAEPGEQAHGYEHRPSASANASANAGAGIVVLLAVGPLSAERAGAESARLQLLTFLRRCE